MNRVLLLMVLLLGITGRALRRRWARASRRPHHAKPGANHVDHRRPDRHAHIWPHRSPNRPDGDLASSMPKVFQLPEDTYMIGYKSEVFTKDGKATPQELSPSHSYAEQ